MLSLQEGVVLGYDVTSGLVELDLTRESLAKPLGKDGMKNDCTVFILTYSHEYPTLIKFSHF